MAGEFNSKWIVTTLVSYRRTIIGTLQSFRIMVSMVNTAVKSVWHPFLGVLFPFFSLAYFISAFTEWGLFLNAVYDLAVLDPNPDVDLAAKEKKAVVDKIYAALSAAVSSTLWGVANLCVILFFASMPLLAISVYMGVCVYELVKGVFDYRRACKEAGADEEKKSRARKDLKEGIGVNLTFIVSCPILLIGLAALVSVNPILMAAAASAIVVALAVDLAWRNYKWRKDRKKQGEESLVNGDSSSSQSELNREHTPRLVYQTQTTLSSSQDLKPLDDSAGSGARSDLSEKDTIEKEEPLNTQNTFSQPFSGSLSLLHPESMNVKEKGKKKEEEICTPSAVTTPPCSIARTVWGSTDSSFSKLLSVSSVSSDDSSFQVLPKKKQAIGTNLVESKQGKTFFPIKRRYSAPAVLFFRKRTHSEPAVISNLKRKDACPAR